MNTMIKVNTSLNLYLTRIKLSLIMIKNDERNEIVWGKNSLGKFKFYIFYSGNTCIKPNDYETGLTERGLISMF